MYINSVSCSGGGSSCGGGGGNVLYKKGVWLQKLVHICEILLEGIHTMKYCKSIHPMSIINTCYTCVLMMY